MASTSVKSKRMIKRLSNKSHSWWWDSHISPKNSKWLQENLEEMDQHVNGMLKLIEEDADSFAKKVEMCYERRPKLIKIVEEFYRMYRALAERYDNVTGELRKSIPADLQSQSSEISDIGSEPPSTMPSPDRQPSHPKLEHHAAGFFIGGGTELSDKEGDESSTLDSESDDSSVQNYTGAQRDEDEDEDKGLQRKVQALEDELREVKEKLQVQEEEIKRGGDEKCEAHDKMIAKYEEELRVAKEKIRLSEEEISRLKELDLCRQSLEKDLKQAKAKQDDQNANISALSGDVSSKDDQMDQMSRHLHQLHMEHVNLIAAAEGARKRANNLRSRIKELEREVDRKEQIIVQGAEEKREAIRQLCFSLEHYRNGYHRLREVVVGNKRVPVMAT